MSPCAQEIKTLSDNRNFSGTCCWLGSWCIPLKQNFLVSAGSHLRDPVGSWRSWGSGRCAGRWSEKAAGHANARHRPSSDNGCSAEAERAGKCIILIIIAILSNKPEHCSMCCMPPVSCSKWCVCVCVCVHNSIMKWEQPYFQAQPSWSASFLLSVLRIFTIPSTKMAPFSSNLALYSFS